MGEKTIFLYLLFNIIMASNLERDCWYWNGNNWQRADATIAQLFLEVNNLTDACNKRIWQIRYFTTVIYEPKRTKTVGYWKTHPEDWPRPYQPGDTFYLSRKTWLQVLWRQPRGDAYYILARQFIAAILNKADGCPVPNDVEEILSQADLWFQTMRPPVRPNTPEGKKAIKWAERLDIYNNTGKISYIVNKDPNLILTGIYLYKKTTKKQKGGNHVKENTPFSYFI